MDVLSSSGLLRVPILIEYDELKRLELNAVTDPLTGSTTGGSSRKHSKRNSSRAALWPASGIGYLDLHRFKEVNDKHAIRAVMTYCELRSTLKKALRTSDSASASAAMSRFIASANGFCAGAGIEPSRPTVFAEMLQRCSLPSL